MSDVKPARLWYFYVTDMLGFCDKVMTFTAGLIHGYLGIDQDTLWSLIKTDIPALHALHALLLAINPPLTDSP